MNNKQEGWTLIELMIVVVIIAIIAIIFLISNWNKSIYRANDTQRKTDLANIRRAFEEYYNDNECYPAITILNTCRGNGLQPYLREIPCDPTRQTPYKYEPDDTGELCQGNRVCAQLQDLNDPEIPKIGCDPVTGCGWGAGWNYCLAAGTTVTAPNFILPTGAPATPTPIISHEGSFACTAPGICQDVGDPQDRGCPQSWADGNCGGAGTCSNPSLWCP
jgi:prepilin-type N-terminal cleavage/methylation domain-containing protein